MSELPQGWINAKLKDLVGAVGLMSDGDWIESKDQDPNGDVRLIQLADIGDGVFIDKSNRFLTSAKAQELRCTYLEAGDLLIARMPDPLGRSCIFPSIENRSVTAVDVCIWRSSPNGVDTRWLMYTVNSPEVRQTIQSQASGTTRQRVSGGNLKRLEIAVPPLAEQRRIAVKLDNLFARTRRAREELEHIPRLVEHYKQAILAAAFRGELTTGLFRQDKVGVHEVTPLWETPIDWHWKCVAQIGDVSLGRQRSPENHQGPSMRPYVRAANITWSGWNLSDVKTMNFNTSDFSRFVLYDGDVLLNEGSGSAKEVGKPAIWRGQIKDCCFQNTLLRVRPRECSSEYLYWYFMYCAISGRFARETQGVNIHHIGKEGLANIAVPYPSPIEQSAIVARIESTISRLTKLVVEHARATNLLSKFEQAMLSKAFRGELVPQDPNDEPASVLLERIRAEQFSHSKVVQNDRKKAITV